MDGLGSDYMIELQNRAYRIAAELGLGIITDNESWYRWVTNYMRIDVMRHMSPEDFRANNDEFVCLMSAQNTLERRCGVHSGLYD